MKKIHIIFKTHLDLGFTDYAQNIIELYNTKFIPDAISLARKVNTLDRKKFIWTIGSWIIHNALNTADEPTKSDLRQALAEGDIAVHGLPFTTHSELLDEDIFEYGLQIAKNLEPITNRQVISAKMTDVPGHTKAIIPILNNYGIQFLHIGVNEGSAVPEVPPAFVWRHTGAEILVLYQKSYGDIYKNENIDDILYFAHSADNMGPLNEKQLDLLYTDLRKKYPDYKIAASTLDEYAKALLKVKEKLPVLEDEIGDSWIHGAATDPYKTGALRELIALKDKWLKDKSLSKGSTEYNGFVDNLLLIGEHTCGLDAKKFLSDIGLYSKKIFLKMRIKDRPRLQLLKRGIAEKLAVLFFRRKKIYVKGSYKAMEKSWDEQRRYIDLAINALNTPHKEEAKHAIQNLIPLNSFDIVSGKKILADTVIKFDGYDIAFNSYGALMKLSYKDNKIIDNNLESLVDYYSCSSKDYDFWRDNYSRNYNQYWVRADFGRPLLQYIDKSYPHGSFAYISDSIVYQDLEDKVRILVKLKTKQILTELLGAPKLVEIMYTFCKKHFSVDFELLWQGKNISRLPESLSVNFPLIADKGSLSYKKLGSNINPLQIVKNGNRNISAVQEVAMDIEGISYILKNIHSPIISIDKVKILKFDNQYKDLAKGLSFNLYNNLWGTNFPLWYGENAYFKYELRLQNT